MNHRILLLLLVVLPLLASCGGGNSGVVQNAAACDSVAGRSELFTHATLISHRAGEGYDVVAVRNPWDSLAPAKTYVLVPSQRPLPADLPPGTVVRVPLSRALVYSSVHSSLISELGAADAIAGVCDAGFLNDTTLAARVANGSIADCGSAMSPSVERIMALRPDAVVLSPYENSGDYGKVGRIGIPLIECADYMEPTPLGRAEWMKFYGMLVGRRDEAVALFEATEAKYDSLKNVVATMATQRPVAVGGTHACVLVDKIYQQSWNVPCRNSTMGLFIRDAGGRNPFDGFDGSGSVALSGEQVLYRASDADIWLIRYYRGGSDLTLSELSAENPLYRRFEAFGRGQVYGCNTASELFYEEIPFHPHWLLQDLIGLLHPMADETGEPRKHYFKKLKP